MSHLLHDAGEAARDLIYADLSQLLDGASQELFELSRIAKAPISEPPVVWLAEFYRRLDNAFRRVEAAWRAGVVITTPAETRLCELLGELEYLHVGVITRLQATHHPLVAPRGVA